MIRYFSLFYVWLLPTVVWIGPGQKKTIGLELCNINCNNTLAKDLNTRSHLHSSKLVDDSVFSSLVISGAFCKW